MKNNTLLLILTLFLFSKQGFAQTISVYGSTVGEANVTPSGAASYIIPIHTPRGVNGFQPNISIIYNSQSGNGILGYGWNISGLSSISRVPSTIYFDGITEGVNLNRMDKLALDGNRLICINADSTEFKTELENFSKIIGGKSDVSYYWFEVKTKDGSTNYYGTTEDSRLRPLGNWSQPLAWYLSKSTDPNGNSINYFYTNQNGEIYIDRIEYANNSIQFIYEDRPDKNVTYFAGASVSQKKRLKGITVKSDGQVARSYSFTYNHDGLFSHLASISETGSDGASLNPTQFIREGINANSTAYSALVETQSYKQIYNADLTGDGRSDVVVTYKSSVESNWTDWAFYEANADGHSFTKKYSGKLPSGFKGFYLSDIDNNGTYDIFMRVSGVYSYCCIQCDELKPQNAIVKPDSLLTKSDAIFKEHSEKTVLPPDDDSNGCCATCSYDRQYMNAYFYSNGNLVRNEQYDIHFDFIKGDAIIYAGLNFDGDGKSDFLILDKSKNFVGVKVGNTYFSAQVFSNNPNDVNLLDYNGDGRTDILVTKEYNSTIYTYNPRSTKFEVLYNSGFPTRWHSVHLGDFNGDGKTDILSYTAGKWNLNFSTGKEFSYPAITNLPFYNANPDDNELMSLFIGDFNGDGRDDVLQTLAYNRDATSNYYYFYISDGMGGFKLLSSGTWDFGVKIAQILKEKSFLGFSWDRKWTSYNGHALADFNGDGKIDVLPYHGKPNARQAIILPFSNDRSRQLLSIVDGIGRQTNFTYKSLTEGSSIYQKGTGATYPLNDIIAPLYVVSSISQPNGIGGTTTTSFLYKGAKIHLLGKGFLGFTEVIASNSSTGIVTTQQFETNTTFYLNLLLKTLVMSSGTKLSEITYTNRLQSFGGKRFAQFIDKIEVFKNPENITFTTTYQYDSYGNATYVKESCPIRTIETTNNYALYGGWGPYNRLTSSTVKTTYSGKTSYIRSISFSYDSKGNLIREITDNGVTKDYTVNPLGVITGITIKASDEPASSTRFDYDSGYRFVIKTTNALGQVNSQLIDPRTGVVLNDIAINGLKTDYIYDGFGRLVKIKTPEGNTITINRIGNPSNAPQGCAYAIETISEGKPKSKVFYDILDREIRSEVEGPSGIIVTEKNYNAKGQLISETSPHYITDPAITTTYKYDVFGRVTAVSRNGRTTTNSYSGTKVTTTTPDGKKYTKEFNSLGNLVSATDNGGSISYSYHSSGQVQTISANGLITSIEYDNFGRQLSITDPSAGKVEYTYYPSGKLKSQKDARGNTYTYTYDALGRIVSASGPDENISYSYETSGGGNGLISSISNSLNSTKKIYKYDSFGRISEFTDKIGDVAMVSSFKYDKYGNITKHTFPSGFVINKTYDSKSNLIQITNDNGGIIWKFVSETATGQPLEYQLGSLLNVNYAYDSDEFLTAISTFANPMPMINSKAFPGDYPLPQGLVLSYSYSFDPLTGNLNWRKDNILNLQEVFTYDNLNRLEKIRMGASEKLVRYEKNGNISFKSDAGMYTYNGYRVTEVASATNNIPTLTQNITYNGFGKVQTIEEGTSSLNFIYGTDRQRIKTIETKGSLTTTRYYTLDHEREVSTTTTDRSYIYSPYGLVAVVEKQADTYTTLLVSTDHLGSIVGLFTTDGKLVQKLSYDAWGNYRNPANYSLPFGEVPRLRRGFTGHEHEPLFGIINMNGRVYDPVLGRFLSPDNFVQAPDFTQNFNRYAYCLNNPLKYTDPTGEIFVIDDILFAAAIGAIINVAVQGMSGHINSAGDFFMAAGIGALAGAGGAFVGGAVAGAIGYGGFAGGATIGAASGFAGGFIGGAGNSWMNGSNFGDGLVAGLKGGLIGGISGGLIGGTIAGIDAVRSGSDFWNGSVNEVGGSGFGTFLDEEIPAGAKPTATGEIAETSTNPNYGKYGMTRNGGAKAHYGVDYAGKEGDDVFAMYDGKVIKIGGSKEYGENFVRTSSTINGKTYNVDYGHMSKSVVSINKMVSAGEKIGEMGRLGNLAGTSFPTHVHIAVWRPVNGLQGFVMPWWK